MNLCHYLTIFWLLCVVRVTVRCQLSSCTTPNGEEASCRSFFSCPILKSSIELGDPSLQKFIEASADACGHGQGSLRVCCGTFGNYTNINTEKVVEKPNKEKTPTTPEGKREYALKYLLPSKKYCGMQHADDYFRDYNKTETTVDELPWVMFLSCSNDNRFYTQWFKDNKVDMVSRQCDCSGVLINKRYVLTARNCESAEWVGIGQRIQKRNISCTATPYGDDCSEAVAEVAITERIFHPNSSLMLLRLNSTVTYNDYTRPICLPLNQDDRIEIEESVTVPYWRFDLATRNFAINKRNVTITSYEKCGFSNPMLYYNYICVITDDNGHSFFTTHKTDSGVPLLYKLRNNWFAGGILFAASHIEERTIINQITPEVVNWILENMKP